MVETTLLMVCRAISFCAGIWLVAFTLLSAVRTFVLPRSDNVWLTRQVFMNTNRLFRFMGRKSTTYAERDRYMAFFAPVALLTMPIVWLTLVTLGYTGIFWAVGVYPPGNPWSFQEAFNLSGSSLLTLGFRYEGEMHVIIFEFTEATIGLLLVAILMAYLPTMYAAFSKRETLISLLEVRAGNPPSAVELLTRYHRIHGLQSLAETWRTWEIWFAELEETHTSLAPLVFFRSPKPDRSWVTAAGVILDSAAIVASTIDIPRNPQTDLCIRAGYIALRSIADFFRIAHNPHPQKGDPISIARQEFDAAYDELVERGLPVKPDRQQCWEDFAGWRVNYDHVLLALAELTMAPYAPWVSDRGLQRSRQQDQ